MTDSGWDQEIGRPTLLRALEAYSKALANQQGHGAAMRAAIAAGSPTDQEISEAMVERASEAGFEAYRHSGALSWKQITEKSRAFWRPIFRAALEAAAKAQEESKP